LRKKKGFFEKKSSMAEHESQHNKIPGIPPIDIAYMDQTVYTQK
jgi:hypothetical protein